MVLFRGVVVTFNRIQIVVHIEIATVMGNERRKIDMSMFKKLKRQKILGTVFIILLVANVLMFASPVSAVDKLTLKWTRLTGTYARTYIGPIAADLTNDGKMEIITTGGTADGGSDGVVTVLDGATGNIVWQTQPNALGGIGMHSPAEAVDINKDGIKEIIVSGRNPVVLFGNNGSIYWKNSAVSSYNLYSPAYDINGDGYYEIFVSSGNGPLNGVDYITSLTYDGKIVNRTTCWHPCWGGMIIGDADSDGRFELYQGDRSYTYSDPADPYKYGGWGIRAIDAHTLRPLWNDSSVLCSSHTPMLADVDKDGQLDVVTGIQSGGFAVYNALTGAVLNTGGKYRKTFNSIRSHSQPTISDIDGDGNLEIITCRSSAISIWDLYQWKLDATIPLVCWEPPMVGDITGDGRMEMIAVNGSHVVAYDINPDGTFTIVDQIGGLISASAHSLVQDVDQDGYNELILTSYAGDQGRVYCFDTPAPAPTPRVRQGLQFYSERHCGAAEYVPPPGPLAPQITSPSPADGTANVSATLTQLSFTLTDFQQDKMNYTVTTTPNIGTQSGTNVANGKQTIPVSGLHYGTSYTWKVNATDGLHSTIKTFTFTTEPPPPWWSPEWQYRRKITIDHTKVTADQTNFPMLVDITDIGFSTKAQTDGDDFVFTNSAQSKLDHQIENYDSASGRLIAWVRIPLLSVTTDTVLYLYYGNPSATSQQNPTTVWDSSFRMILHLNEKTGTQYDSTVNGNNGTPNNGVLAGVSGKIDGADTFDGVNDYVEVPHSSTITGFTSAFTASFWLRLDDTARRQAILNKFDSTGNQRGWFIEYQTHPSYGKVLGFFASQDGVSYREWYASFSPTAGTWYGVTVIWESNTVPRFYVNDAQVTTINTGTINSIYNNAGTPLHIGRSTYNTARYLRGSLDEIRISNPARSASWIMTCYNNEKDPSSFYTVAPEEGFEAPQAPVVSNPSPANSATGVQLNPVLSITATDYQSQPMNIIFRSNATGTWKDLGSYIGVSNGVYNQTTKHMDKYSTTYFWSVHVTDGTLWANKTYSFTTRAEPQKWWNTNWQYRRMVTVDHTKVSGNQTNFPVLVELRDTGLAGKAQPDGDDFVFTDLAANKLDHEIELYSSTTGHLVAWVKIPSISSTINTILYLYYGNPSVGSQQNSVAIWDPNYRMVQHHEENSGTRIDSTSNLSNLTPSGGVAKSASERIDGADSLDGVTGSLRSTSFSLYGQKEIMMEAWVNINSLPAVARYAKSHMYGRSLPAPLYWYGLYMYVPNTNPISRFTLSISLYNSGTASIRTFSYTANAVDQWVHVAWGLSKTTGRTYFYVNGLQVRSDDISSLLSSGFITPLDDTAVSVFSMGSNTNGNEYMKLLSDETRISNVTRPAGWLLTSYNNQKDPFLFCAFSAEEALPAEPIVSDPTPEDEATDVSITTFELSFNLTDYQHDLMSYTVTTSPDIGSDAQTGIPNGRYVISVHNLSYATAYTWTVNATDGTHASSRTFTFITEALPPSDDVVFNSSFDMGNLKNVQYQGGDSSGHRYYTGEQNHTTASSMTDKHWWFYFSMDNVAGKIVQIKLVNNEAADFSGNRWNEIEPVYSYDNVHWERLPSTAYLSNASARAFTMTVTPTQNKIWLAPLPPYNIVKRDALFAEFASSPYLNITSLGTTPGGQELKVATITDPAYSNVGKFKSYVIAQQHAGEVPGSWNAEGLIRYLLSDDPTAALIRRSYIFRIIPIVNVDGVFQGRSRYTPLRSGVQYDLNREWTKAVASMQPEIRWIWQDLLAFKPNSFNDMHSTINTEVGSPKEALTYTWSTSDPTIIAFRAKVKLGGYPETVTGTTSYACTVVHNSAALGNIKESVSWENPHDELSTNPGVKLTVNDWMSWGAGWAKGNYLHFGEKPHYTLTVNTVGNGSVTKIPNQPSYMNGSIVTLTATPNAGWVFNGWSGDLTGSVNPVNVTMNTNKTVTATFTLNQYTLTVNTDGGGSVTLNRTDPYYYGDVIQLTAVPSTGWSFSHWTGDLAGSTNPTTLTMNGNKAVTAVFSQNQYTLSITIEGGGIVSKLPDQATYVYGAEVQLTAIADPGWVFTGWTGDLSGSTNPATITIDGNKAVTATFTQNHYTLTVNVTGNGQVSKFPDQATYTYGSIVQLTAAADSGWALSYWTGDLTGSANPASLNITGNMTVTAVFTQDQYTLTVNIVGEGSVFRLPDQGAYTYGAEVQLTALAYPGWTFAGWSGDLSGNTSPTTITMNGSKTVTATFTQNFYTLTVNVDGSGSVTLNVSGPYTYGSAVMLTATASTGWSFSTWSGDLTGSQNPAVIVIDGNKTVTATFTRDQYTLTITIVGSGSVTRNVSEPYYYDTVVELTATANFGWKFTGWSGDLSETANPATIIMNGNKAVTATFMANQAPTIDSYAPTGNYPCVNQGNQQAFSVSATDPDSDPITYEWYVDGTLQSTTDSYTFVASSGTSGAHNVTTIVRDNQGGQAKHTWLLTVDAFLVMPFDSNTLPVTDYAGYDNNGTLNGATWTSSGKVGGAYSFDGVNDYVQISDNVNLDGNGTWSQLTIDFWMRIAATQNGKRIIAKRGSTSGTYSYQVGFQTANGRLYFDVWNSALYEVEYTTLLSVNAWHHIVCVYKSGTGSKIFVNGTDVNAVQVGTGSITGLIAKSRGQALFFGCRYGTQDFFAGLLDEVRIYSKALNQTQFAQATITNANVPVSQNAYVLLLYMAILASIVRPLYRTKRKRIVPSFFLSLP